MGLAEKWHSYQKSRNRRRVEKAVKVIKNPKAIKEDRWAGISYLAESCDDLADAVNGLLQRFEYSLEHGINDTREKELALKGILRFGNPALPIVKDWLKKTSRIAWPIKAIRGLSKDDTELVETLKSALNFEDVTFDHDAVDKNYDILCYLRDYSLKGFFAEIAHFLNDPDERVRFAATEALLEQEDADVTQYLVGFLNDETSENRRIRLSVEQAYSKFGWERPQVENAD